MDGQELSVEIRGKVAHFYQEGDQLRCKINDYDSGYCVGNIATDEKIIGIYENNGRLVIKTKNEHNSTSEHFGTIPPALAQYKSKKADKIKSKKSKMKSFDFDDGGDDCDCNCGCLCAPCKVLWWLFKACLCLFTFGLLNLDE